MPSKCNYCGEIAVDDTENEAVCHACGVVAQETKFSSQDYSQGPSTRGRFVPYTRFEAQVHNNKKRSSVCLAYGLTVLDQLCHQNSVNATIKTEMTHLLQKICTEKRFGHREDTGVVAACCLFLVQRKHKQPIPVKRICSQLGCAKRKFSQCLNLVKSFIPTHAVDEEDKSVEATLAAYLDLKQSSEDMSNLAILVEDVCNRADKEERTKLKEKVTALVKLSNDCWILPGRLPSGVVVACGYLCWKSMNPLRRRASFAKYSKLMSIHEPIAKLRILELEKFLLKLAQKIPSYYDKNGITRDNLVFYLDIILENSESLRNDLLEHTHDADAINAEEFSNFRFPPTTQHRREPAVKVKYDSDMNASDIEISDTEIESYVDKGKSKLVELCERKIKKEEDFRPKSEF